MHTDQNPVQAFTPSPDSILLGADELAQILRVPRSWVYSHLRELPVIRLGRYVRFKRSEVERFLEERGSCQRLSLVLLIDHG